MNAFRRLLPSWLRSRKSNHSIAPKRRRIVPRLEVLENRMTPTVIHWTDGGHDGLWSNPLNWDLWVPGMADDASIGNGYTVTNDLADSGVNSVTSLSPIAFLGNFGIAAISSITPTSGGVSFAGVLGLGGSLYLDCMLSGGNFAQDIHIANGAQLTLAGGTFNFASGVDADGDGVVAVWSAQVIVDGTVSFTNLDLKYNGAKMIGDTADTVTIKDTMHFEAGMLQGGATLAIEPAAELDFNTNADKTIDGWLVNNAGLASWSGGDIYSTASTFNNQAAATFNIEGGMSTAGDWLATGGSFENAGTFNSMGGGHTMGIAFNSTNFVQVLAGTLKFDAGGASSGEYDIAGEVDFSTTEYSFTSLDIVGSGLVLDRTTIHAQSLNIRNRTFWFIGAGEFRGAGDVTVSSATTFNWTGGLIRGGGTMDFLAGSILNIDSVGNPASSTQGFVGTFDTKRIRVLYGATVNWLSGDIALGSEGTFENRGTFNVLNLPSGSLRDFISPQEVEGWFWNYGLFRKMEAGTLLTTVIRNNVSLGEIRIEGGEMRLESPGFMNSGVVTVLEGTVNVSCGVFGTVTTGYWTASAGAQVNFKTGQNDFDPSGNGLVDKMQGDGYYTVQGTAKLRVIGEIRASNFLLTVGGILQGSGTFSAHVFDWGGGKMEDNGTTVVRAGDQLNIGLGDVRIETRTLLIQGEARWFGTGNIIDRDAPITVDGGYFEIQNSATIENDMNFPGAVLTIANGGLLKKSMGEGTTIDIPVVNNASRVEVFPFTIMFRSYRQIGNAHLAGGGGTLEVAGTFEQEGGTVTITGGAFDVQGDLLLEGESFESDAAVLSVAGDLRVDGASALLNQGSATIAGNLDLLSGLLTVRLAVTVGGNYTQSASGELTVYLDGLSNNQIFVTGVASLAGGFTALLEEGLDPGPGDRFFVLSYASHSGEFDSYSLPPLSAGSWEWWYDDPEYPNTFGLQVVA